MILRKRISESPVIWRLDGKNDIISVILKIIKRYFPPSSGSTSCIL